MENPTISQLSRRKACDLCFTKKIKCDMIKPHCSNCKQYGAECKTTPVRRRAGQPKHKPGVAEVSPESENTRHSPESQEKVSGLESRLARIEEQLQQVLNVASAAIITARANSSKTNTNVPIDPALTAITSTPTVENITSWLQSSTASSCSSSLSFDDSPPATESSNSTTVIRTSSSSSSSNQQSKQLPPIETILPTMDHYFTQINRVIPLFSQPQVTRLLNEWYTYPSRRTNAAWAAVNIILALGSRLPTTPILDMDFQNETAPFGQYLTNAQSVLSELVVRDQDLLGLQTLLGLVLLYQTLPDPRPGTVLIGAAVRLVHRLRMQSRDDIRILYPAEEGLHRTRLFWITYFLDKEISMRHHTPSMQLDADIDQDLPSPDPADGMGDIFTLNGKVRVNYLRLRVRLAHIHGRIYDLLYSTRSSKISKVERQARVVRLSYLLENWRSSVPVEMQPGMMGDHLGRMGLVFMASMHCSYVACMIMVHGVWSYQAEWVKKVSSYSQIALKDNDTEGARCCTLQNPPLPSAWKRCVQIARECLRMISKIPQSDGNIWFNASALFSSAVVVLSHIREFPGQDGLEEDKKLTEYTLNFLGKVRDMSVLVPLQKMQGIVDELDRNAAIAIQTAREKRQALRDRLLGGSSVENSVLFQGAAEKWVRSQELLAQNGESSADAVAPGMVWETNGAHVLELGSDSIPQPEEVDVWGQEIVFDDFLPTGQMFEFGEPLLS
ncbi:fungal-specific transcription factor domain-containing protein [Cladorrhinum sp. PSN259]|nr:fungal-specific transcription factor domain-containing protein [Cladorrhinum sp. PSN259]